MAPRLGGWAALAAMLLSLAGCFDLGRDIDDDADQAGHWADRAGDKAGKAATQDADDAADWQRRTAQRDGPETSNVAGETLGATAKAYVEVMADALQGDDEPADTTRLVDHPTVYFQGFPDGPDLARRQIVGDYVHDMIYRFPIQVTPTCKLEWITCNGQHQSEVTFCLRLSGRPWTDEEPAALAYCLHECAGLWKQMQQQDCATAGSLLYRLQFFLPVGSKVQEVANTYKPDNPPPTRP